MSKLPSIQPTRVDNPSPSAGSWWVPLRPALSAPSTVVLAAAHGGAGTSVLRPLGRFLPDDWQMLMLLLPGREARRREPPAWTYQETVRDAAAALADALDRQPGGPAVAIGQCSGAWLLYGILAASSPQVHERCAALITLSQRPWDAPRPAAPLSDDPEVLWAELVSAGLANESAAAYPELRQLATPVIRADFAAMATFPVNVPALTCPIVAVGGRRDLDAEDLDLKRWARYTPQLILEWLDVGHLPLRDAPAEVAALIGREASRVQDGAKIGGVSGRRHLSQAGHNDKADHPGPAGVGQHDVAHRPTVRHDGEDD
jgi:surfactin synthase thioesterase subunit